MSKPETFTLRIETELLDEARKTAKARGRSLSALMREALLDLLRGRRKEAAPPKKSRS